MASLRGRLFRFALRHAHLLRFQWKRRTVFDWNTSIPGFREDCEKAARMFGKPPAGTEVSPVAIRDLPAEWILPPKASQNRAILYAHGGGYVSGSCRSHRVHAGKFAAGTGAGVLLFDYRLAPEHPFPAALEDTLTAYEWMLARGIPASHIALAGESAGGGLALAALLAIRDRGIPLPAAAVVLSPWTDLKCTGHSHITRAGVCLAPKGSSTVFSKYYAGDNDPGLPLISPLYGDLHGLPPMLIHVGEYEVLLDDSTRYAAKAKAAGVDVTLRVWEKMFHCFPLCSPLFPEARRAMDESCAFIRTRI